MCPTPPSKLLFGSLELDDDGSSTSLIIPHERVKRQRNKDKKHVGSIGISSTFHEEPIVIEQLHALPSSEPSPTSQSSVESSISPSISSPDSLTTSTNTSTPTPTPLPTHSNLISSNAPITPISEPTPSLKRSLPLSSSHSISCTASPTPSISSHSSSPSCSPRTLGPIRRSRSSRLTSTEMRRRRHRYKDGIRYHSLKAQLDHLREVTLEFQTHVAREWETRTDEWSEPKQANKKVLDRIREQRPDCGRAVLLHSASAMIRHLNNEVTELRAKIAQHQDDSIQPMIMEPSDSDLTACMEAMIRLAHDQQMLQMGGCMITRYSMDGMVMETNDLSCQYGYTQESVIGTICTSLPHMEEAVPLPPTVDLATTTAKQLMTTFLPTSNLVTPWWQHMLLVPIGMVVPFISRRRTPQGQYEMNIYWRQVEQGIDGIRSIYSVGWDAKVEFSPIPTTKLLSSSTVPLPISTIPTSIIEIS